MTATPARIGPDVAQLRPRLNAAAAKARIMEAYEAGEFTAQEASDWIAIWGLEEA